MTRPGLAAVPADTAAPPGGAASARVLILSAPVGESHGAMARSLASELGGPDGGTSVRVLEDLAVLGPRLGRLLARGFRIHLGQGRRSYDLAYRMFGGLAAGRAAGEAALYLLGGGALERAVERERPDVVVCTYPIYTPVLGRLRAAGRLPCPVLAVVEPVGGLAYWTHPRVDLHALMYPEALAEARRLTGEIRALPARPLVASEFLEPRPPREARAALGLTGPRPLVLVSGGGWGVGDLAGAVVASLAAGDVEVVVVAGRNRALQESLQQRFGADLRVRVVGFTDRMRDLLCAADAFVTASAGLSCMEARLCGAPTICYGFQLGHVRDNTRALAAHGLARVAVTPERLSAELVAALSAGRERAPELGRLPSVGELALGLAYGVGLGGSSADR